MDKILMVQEETQEVKNALERLSQAGFEVFSAPTGNKGLQLAKDKGPNLIITDAFISEISAYELCKAIKNEERIKSTPILITTENHRMVDSFMFLGIHSFLNRPYTQDDLEFAIRIELRKSQPVTHTKILMNGLPKVLACCEEMIKQDTLWEGVFVSDNALFLETVLREVPDVILMDLILPGFYVDEMIQKIKLAPKFKNTVILTYYSNPFTSKDDFAVQAQAIEVQYLKHIAQESGAQEYLGPFSPGTFMNLINLYRKDTNFLN